MPTIEQLESLLEKEPEDTFLHFGLAMALRSAGRSDEALARFERVRSLDADYIAAYFQQAQLEAQLGRTDEARATLRQGIERAQATGDDHARGEMLEYLESLDSSPPSVSPPAVR